METKNNHLNPWNFFLYLYALQQQQEITVFDWSVGLVGTINKKNKTKKTNKKKKCIPLITLLVVMVMHILLLAEAYSEPCQTSKMKSLAKIVNSF